jgi:hypothetical protein
MNKQEISQLRSLAFEALKSMKTYMDFGGDSANLQVLAAFFKWPDVVLSLLDLMEKKEGALAQCVSDFGFIMLQPLRAVCEALLERYKIKDKDDFKKVLSTPVDSENMAEIVKARKAYIAMITQISKEVASENRDSRDSQ